MPVDFDDHAAAEALATWAGRVERLESELSDRGMEIRVLTEERDFLRTVVGDIEKRSAELQEQVELLKYNTARSALVFGEQVASRDGLGWLDAVCADLERCGYSVGAADLCAAGVGAPHIRQRLYFVAHTDGVPRGLQLCQRGPEHQVPQAGRSGQAGDVANAGSARPQDRRDAGTTVRRGDARGMANPEAARCPTRRHNSAHGRPAIQPDRHVADGWADADWIPCSDGVSRPVEPGTFPLAHGVPARVGLLSGYGNAIVPQVAAAFIRASLEAIELATGKPR